MVKPYDYLLFMKGFVHKLKMNLKMIKANIILFLSLISTNLVGQDDSWKYFGQTPPGKSAQLFAPELIT